MDTPEDVADRIAKFHAALTPDERWRIASGMFETAKAIVASSLSPDLSAADRALAMARRMYAAELPEAALRALVGAHTKST